MRFSIKSLTHTLGTTRPTHRPNLKWRRSAPSQLRAPRVLSSGALRACSAWQYYCCTASSAAVQQVSAVSSPPVICASPFVVLVLDRQALLSRVTSAGATSAIAYLSAPFYKFDRRHVAVRLSQRQSSLGARWLRGCLCC